MKYLLLCEGQNEETLLNILLDKDLLVFSRANLIGRRPYPVRQLDNSFIKTELKHYGQEVIVYRIGDKQNDILRIPNDLKNIVSKDKIYKYCTKPELEMLLIINEGLEKRYEKVKSVESPKSFAKKYIRFNGKKYDQSSNFYEEYYGEENVKYLVSNIKKYKNYKKHNHGELYLADLLK